MKLLLGCPECCHDVVMTETGFFCVECGHTERFTKKKWKEILKLHKENKDAQMAN